MRINALVVCVNFSDLFTRSITRWARNCDRIVCVTIPGDNETHQLCGSHGVEVFATDAFYRDGAYFAKSRAMTEAIDATGWTNADLLLTFDADISPPVDWRDEAEKIKPGYLYGTPRFAVDEDGPLIIDRARRIPHSQPQGYFSLFHADEFPGLDVTYQHAGWYDVAFANHWPRDRWRDLPIDLIHLGKPCENWLGRDRKEECRDMMRHRDKYKERIA